MSLAVAFNGCAAAGAPEYLPWVSHGIRAGTLLFPVLPSDVAPSIPAPHSPHTPVHLDDSPSSYGRLERAGGSLRVRLPLASAGAQSEDMLLKRPLGNVWLPGRLPLATLWLHHSSAISQARAFSVLAATGRVGSVAAQAVNGALMSHLTLLLAVTDSQSNPSHGLYLHLSM